MQALHRANPQRAAPVLHEARDLSVIVSIREADVHGREADRLALSDRQAIQTIVGADPDDAGAILEE